jgi:hypothetical protein
MKHAYIYVLTLVIIGSTIIYLLTLQFENYKLIILNYEKNYTHFNCSAVCNFNSILTDTNGVGVRSDDVFSIDNNKWCP